MHLIDLVRRRNKLRAPSRLIGLAATAAVVSAVTLAPAARTSANAAPSDPAVSGAWSQPFEEDPGNNVYPLPEDSYHPDTSSEHCYKVTDPDKKERLVCKPAAVSMMVLRDGRVLYWNGLEGLENVKYFYGTEIAADGRNSQARILDLRKGVRNAGWSIPTPSNGGGGDIFCSDQVHLADGRILAAGGTNYYNHDLALPAHNVPNAVSGPPELDEYGFPEIEGIKNSRIFDPATDTFNQTGDMKYARWYPGMVQLGDGKVFVGGGVRKAVQTDGTNVENTETFDPKETDMATNVKGKWTDNGDSGKDPQPLYPRYHLLPNGDVYYSADGEMWSPLGESVDELKYAQRKSYDPAKNSWTQYGIGKLGARSGAFSVLLPLHPDTDTKGLSTGNYNHADVLVGGGTLGPTPSSYVANDLTEIHSFDLGNGTKPDQSAPTFNLGPRLQNKRWSSTAVTLPNDAVALFGGADRDSVIDPGTEFPVRMAEWYLNGAWNQLSPAHRDRTYHNTAVLLPDATVLVGGSAPLPAHHGAYSNYMQDISGGRTANNFRDPSFEIFSPPYLFQGPRPSIEQVQSGIKWGSTVEIRTPDAATISSVRLIRQQAITHEIDSDTRSVDVPIVGRTGGSVLVTVPSNQNVAPAGSYYLFLNRLNKDKGVNHSGRGDALVPSTAAIVIVGPEANYASAPIPFPNGPSTASDHAKEGSAHPAPAEDKTPVPNDVPVAPLPGLTAGRAWRGATLDRFYGLI